MSDDVLRRAAERLRDPNRCNGNAYEPALADWLESVPACADCEPASEAREVARLILGESE